MGDRVAELLSDVANGGTDISRATSPGADSWRDSNGEVIVDGRGSSGHGRPHRHRPRTFPYFRYLPYDTETQDEREKNLNVCIEHLYICVQAGDFAPGAVHWTREIRAWLSLKFDLPRDTRINLVRLYYELALAPGMDYLVAERFASMFMVLTK
jgi:proteasome activator subunit 4